MPGALHNDCFLTQNASWARQVIGIEGGYALAFEKVTQTMESKWQKRSLGTLRA